MKFCVIPDAHLGYRQHSLEERRDDFYKAFHQCVEKAIMVQASFVIIAGDLFHTRTPDWHDISQALDMFKLLKNCGLGVYAIRGNHDAPSYTDRMGWNELFEKNKWIDALPGWYEDINRDIHYNIHGLNWQTDLNETLRNYKVYRQSNDFNILVLHGGIDNIMYHDKAQVSIETLNSLKDKFNVIFLGHIHKPYSIDNWIFSPGSLENVSVAETQWPNRGMLIVEVDKELNFTVETFAPKRRKTLTYEQDIHSVDNWIDSWLYYQNESEGSMLFVTLTGQIENPLTTEYLSLIEKGIKENSKALFVKIKNQTTLPNEPIKLGEEISTDKAYQFVFGTYAEEAKAIKDDLLNKRKINLEHL